MVILLGLVAGVLYGTGDFLGGLATRRVQVLAVLMLAETAGVIVAVPAAAMSPGPVRLAGLAWGISAGLVGGLGLIIFYVGLAAGPMSVVAPVSGLVSTILPVAVALAEGERPSPEVYAGALLCLAAIVLASSAGAGDPARGSRAARRPGLTSAGLTRAGLTRAGLTSAGLTSAGLTGAGRAVGYGIASGASFGLFFLLIRNAGQSGELWPVAAGRIGELAIVLVAAAVLRRSLMPRGAGSILLLAVACAGAIDVVANICYVAATRTGMFGLAVVLASLYPGVTVLLARAVLGERLRWVQRIGLGLAALGIILVAA
jgi:drug/metabolite transporter (DMT)-like permease